MKKESAALLLFAVFLLLPGCSEEKKAALEPPGAAAAAPASAQAEVSEQPSETPAAPEAIKVYLNGNRLTLTAAPEADGDSVLVPVAEICACFSREITAESEGDTLTLTDTKLNKAIVLTEGERKATAGGSTVTLNAPMKRTGDGIFLMELSDFTTLFSADIKYQADILTAYITESGLC